MKVRYDASTFIPLTGDEASFPFTHLFRRQSMLFTEANIKKYNLIPTKNSNNIERCY